MESESAPTTEETSTPSPLGRRLAVRVPEAARLLDIGRSKCYDLVRRGELPAIRVGKTVRIPLGALQEWVERKALATTDTPPPDKERKRHGQKNTR
jgi:excisionase family DNA binding protein